MFPSEKTTGQQRTVCSSGVEAIGMSGAEEICAEDFSTRQFFA
jgi:hypothetical protein